jgi:23S rRNA pseudouridine2605 synthase
MNVPGKGRRKKNENRTTYQTPQYKPLQKQDNRKADQKRKKMIRLNSYIAKAGICSRREADKLIQSGSITVNDKVVTELGTKISPGDKVKFQGKPIKREKLVYVLLNKPKDFITTTNDPEERRTVMELVSNSCEERIYPVGRLDRNTTGLLLFTNDGDLADKLTHPSNRVQKLYEVELNKPVGQQVLDEIMIGITLEDGLIQVDDIAIVSKDRKVVGIELHSGRNRIVRRIFEHFGLRIKRLDRVMYAGITKKDLPRGKWRYLREKEVIMLKYMLK